MYKWRVVIILALAQFVMVLDSTVMNVSISTIVKDLNTDIASLQTAITFYTLTMAALMLIGAKFSSRLGLLRAFMIGSIIYGIGSLLTAASQNIGTLLIGWSLIEGLGAVLVIPSIAALVAINYKGKDRITAYAIIGGISGAAAAAGPLIGGFVATYFSWRYVFLAETFIMIGVLFACKSFKGTSPDKKQVIDFQSALLSAFGMVAIVYGLLQSKTWGWVDPMSIPTINGVEIAPFGISVVAYLLVIGIVLLKKFYDRQVHLEGSKKSPLLYVSMLKSPQLRSGLAVLTGQNIITAAVFFIVPIYLQIVLGLNALDTGLRLFPLSIALIFCSVLGSRMSSRYSTQKIVRCGQYLLILGTLCLLGAINPSLDGIAFGLAMFSTGSGLGLLASQLGNNNMSAVDASKTSDVGGLQGSIQNLGSSLGTAVIGSVLIASFASGFSNRISTTDLPQQIKSYITTQSATGIEIVSTVEVQNYALQQGVSQENAQVIANTYGDAQVSGLKESAFFLFGISIIMTLFSRGIPNKKQS